MASAVDGVSLALKVSDGRPSCVLSGPSISSVTSSLLFELNEDKLLELDDEDDEELLELDDEDELLELDEEELLELEDDDDDELLELDDELLELESDDFELKLL